MPESTELQLHPLKQLEDAKSMEDMGKMYIGIWFGAFNEAMERGDDDPGGMANTVLTCHIRALMNASMDQKDDTSDE